MLESQITSSSFNVKIILRSNGKILLNVNVFVIYVFTKMAFLVQNHFPEIFVFATADSFLDGLYV